MVNSNIMVTYILLMCICWFVTQFKSMLHYKCTKSRHWKGRQEQSWAFQINCLSNCPAQSFNMKTRGDGGGLARTGNTW